MDLKNSKDTYLTMEEPWEDPIKPAWENVVLRGLPPGHPVRPEILRSWVKCREMGLDPLSESPPSILFGEGLNKLFRKNREILLVSKPVLDMIEISVKDTGFIITLSDNEGFVLVARGDRDILDMAERNYYMPGCLRTIENAGTNAIGVCLLEGKPIQITGAEHYRVRHHPWTCSSATIHDSQGNIIGVITLSGRSIGQHKHTLALVSAAAKIVESQISERGLINEKVRLNSMLILVFNAISDGVIAIDNRLVITHVNSTAAQMLDLGVESVIGMRFDKVIQSEESLISGLKTKEYFTGREVSFMCPSGEKNYICKIDPIKDTFADNFGSIITMSEKRQMIRITKKIGGNYAKYQFEDIKGKDERLTKQIEIAKMAAGTDSKILIIGESGTGKELFAHAIHNFSNRRDEPFIAISCATIPRDLIESELFGYRGGAFTGARRDGQVGKFELANRGTLFFDDINGLPLDLQTKLLRVLQENEIIRLGDTRPILLDIRVIAASNTNLIDEVENSNFREDLYYRLNVVEIFIPPLRERIQDLELLIDHTLKRLCQKKGISTVKISDEVFEILKKYDWPGNIRELENCIERAVLISQGKPIQKVHLPHTIYRKQTHLFKATMSLNDGYKKIIEMTLNRCGGNLSKAAKELRISRTTLYRKIKEFGLVTGHYYVA